MQLSRLINAIQANKRHYLRIREDQDLTVLRDQIELILFHGAIVFEAITTVGTYGRDLSALGAWSSHSDLVKRVQIEANQNTSFTQKYLKPIRNKVVFHYDIDAVEAVLSGFQLLDDASFGEAKTKRDRDIAFVLADEILLHFVIDPIEERKTENDRWDFFQERLLEISDDLVELLLWLTIELAQGFTEMEETND